MLLRSALASTCKGSVCCAVVVRCSLCLPQDHSIPPSPALLFNSSHSPLRGVGLSQPNFFHWFGKYCWPGTGPEPHLRPSFFSCRGRKILAIQTSCVLGHERGPGFVLFIGIGVKNELCLIKLKALKKG